jgi:hypothetical protein
MRAIVAIVDVAIVEDVAIVDTHFLVRRGPGDAAS